MQHDKCIKCHKNVAPKQNKGAVPTGLVPQGVPVLDTEYYENKWRNEYNEYVSKNVTKEGKKKPIKHKNNGEIKKSKKNIIEKKKLNVRDILNISTEPDNPKKRHCHRSSSSEDRKPKKHHHKYSSSSSEDRKPKKHHHHKYSSSSSSSEDIKTKKHHHHKYSSSSSEDRKPKKHHHHKHSSSSSSECRKPRKHHHHKHSSSSSCSDSCSSCSCEIIVDYCGNNNYPCHITQSGTIAVSNVQPSTITTGTIIFSKPYVVPPTVCATLYPSSSITLIDLSGLNVTVTDINAVQFTWMVSNISPNIFNGSINWISHFM